MSQEFLPTRERSRQIQSRSLASPTRIGVRELVPAFLSGETSPRLFLAHGCAGKQHSARSKRETRGHFSEPYRGGQNPIFHGKPCRNVRDLFATSGADKVFTASVWGKKPFHFPREMRGFERRRVDTTLKKGWSASAATKIFNSRSSDVAANPIHDPPL